MTAHWVLSMVDGSDHYLVAVAHTYEEAVEAGRQSVTQYSTEGSDEERETIDAYNLSLAENLAYPENSEDDVQFESGSASYDYWIKKVGS